MSWKKYIIIALLVVVLLIVASTGAKGNTQKLNIKAKDCRIPRGLRNNNPGNIRYSSANDWRGKVPYDRNTDYSCETGEVVKAFEQFVEFKYGIRAMIVLLKNYISGGHNTIRKLVSKYAPSSENQTAKYVDFVATNTSIDPDQILTGGFGELRKIVQAMAYKENGIDSISYKQFNDAWKMISS